MIGKKIASRIYLSFLSEKEVAVIGGSFNGHVEVMQKTKRNSMEVLVMELGVSERKELWSFE